MKRPAIVYNLTFDRRLRESLTWPDSKKSLSAEDFLKFALQKNHSLYDSLAGAGGGLSVAEDGTIDKLRTEFFFNILIQAGRQRPGLFPVPDLCLAAFNILATRHDLSTCRLVCLDLALLPAAVLAAGRGAQIAPPLNSWPKDLLNTTEDRTLEGALILASDPLKLTEDHPDLLDDLAKAKGGIIFCFWDFLGVKLHSQARMKWLDTGLIRSLVQLPLPRRQSAVYYPALVEIGPSPQEPSLIRLADVREGVSGELSQAEVLEAVFDQAAPAKSLDVTPVQLANQEDQDFTPRRFLADPQGIGEVALSSCANLLRCQALRSKPREKTDYFVCREILFSQLDDITGFVQPGAGHLVELPGFNPEGKEKKYLLQQNDILICYRGTEASIGRVGLMAVAPDKYMIAGQSLCIVRVFDGDPIWLYYYLRQEKFRQRLLSRSSGSKMLTVNLEDLRKLAVVQPGPTQMAVVGQKHNNILVIMENMRQLADQVGDELRALDRSVS